ncbi:MAG TPA: hypothetical protein VNJ09_04365 [Chthonomonadales bacterium]|nr:hypothetical protein [Chthonomonadales bacterium]
MQKRLWSRRAAGAFTRISIMAFLASLVMMAGLSRPAQAQWAYNWDAEEYILSYGNTGFVTFLCRYNLLEYNGQPVKTIDIKLLNKGTIAAQIDNVQFSPDRDQAVVNATGAFSYQQYQLVNGRWTLVKSVAEVKIVATFDKVRERAAYVSLSITDADGNVIYDSNGPFSFMFYTQMK